MTVQEELRGCSRSPEPCALSHMGEGILSPLHSLLLSNAASARMLCASFCLKLQQSPCLSYHHRSSVYPQGQGIILFWTCKSCMDFFLILPSQLVSGKTLNLGLHLLDSTFHLRLQFYNFIF